MKEVNTKRVVVLAALATLAVLTISEVLRFDSSAERIVRDMQTVERAIKTASTSALLDEEARAFALQRFLVRLPDFERDVFVYAVFRQRVCRAILAKLPVTEPEQACRKLYEVTSNRDWLREMELTEHLETRVLASRGLITDRLLKSIAAAPDTIPGYYVEMLPQMRRVFEEYARDDASKRDGVAQVMRSFAAGLDTLEELRHDRTALCEILDDMERYQFDTGEFSEAYLQWESEMKRLSDSGLGVDTTEMDDAYVAGMLAGCDVLDRHEFRVSIVSQLAYAARDFADQIKGE